MKRVALIGAGLAAGAHLRALAALGHDVATVVTGDDARLARVRQHFPGARACRDVAEALAADVDAALVLTPPATHLEIVSTVAGAGVPAVVEKPLDVSLPRAIRLVEAAENAGTGLAVCLQHRAKPAATALRTALDDGLLGEPLTTAVTVGWWRDPGYYAEPGRGTYARDGGGVLITQAIHVLDLVLWLVGAPARVSAVAGRSPRHHAEAETVVGAVLDYGGGRSVTLTTTVAAYPGDDERVLLVGSEGTAELVGAALRTHLVSGAEGPHVDAGERSSGVSDPADVPTAWHEALLADAFAAFDAGRPPLADGASALVTQRVIAAVYRAARTGDWVAYDDPALADER